MKQKFGGDWTEKKLDCIQDYLQAYVRILSNTTYKYAYIDAFAGTGYREMKDDEIDQLMIPELAENETELLLEGSVFRAFQVRPMFHKYIFIEKNINKCKELEETIEKEIEFNEKISVINKDANEYISDLCRVTWTNHRAVLFLDPFGMQVKWDTIEQVAKTKAIDTWILFPLGIGVSRLLKKDGQIKQAWKTKLDEIFGTEEWFQEFYGITIENTLFGQEEKMQKNVDFARISSYYINRLRKVFSKVSDKPAKLLNSKNNPMFLLCFAAGNPRGAETAVKIANDLLKRIE